MNFLLFILPYQFQAKMNLAYGHLCGQRCYLYFDQIEIMEAETIHLIFTQLEKCCTRGNFMMKLDLNQNHVQPFSKKKFCTTNMFNTDLFGHSGPYVDEYAYKCSPCHSQTNKV